MTLPISGFLSCAAAVALFALLVPTRLVGQDKQSGSPQHHHYKLIDIGTFGGPQSYFNSLNLTDAFGFGTVFYNIAQVRNQRGAFIGFADTTIPDPFPDYCYVPECFVTHAFQFLDGKKTDLGALPGGASSAPFWINSRGWITGNSENGETDPLISGLPEIRAVLWREGKIRDLGTLGGNTSFAQAINDRGQITGLALNGTPNPFSYYYLYLYGSSSGTESRGFLWDQENGMQDIGTLGGANAFPSLINNRGQIAGYSDTSFIPDPDVGIPPLHPFLWEKGKRMKDLGSFGGVETASVNGLNERGEVVGGLFLRGEQQIHPFLWNGRKLIDLTAPPFGGPGPGEASWINEGGEVVGGASLPTLCPDESRYIQNAFLWRTGTIADLGSFSATPNSGAVFINSKSQVVGMSFSCDGLTAVAFLWEDGSIVDLNTLTPPDSEFQLFWAGYITDNGEIGAFGNLSNGDTHSVLLIPCDEKHPKVEGCDYALTDGLAQKSLPAAVPETLRRMLQTRFAQRAFRSRFPALRPTN